MERYWSRRCVSFLRHALAGISCLTAAGCDRVAQPVVSAVRDSAGVTIVELRAEPEPTAAILAVAPAEPRLESERFYLHQVVGGVLLAHGGYAVASRGTNQVVLYDSAGVPRSSIGRQGTGPAEFTHLANLVRLSPDTMAAFDQQLRRVTLLTKEAPVRDYTIEMPARSGFVVRAAGALDKGELLLYTMLGNAGSPPDGVGAVPELLFTVGPTGNVAGVVGEFAGTEQYLGTTPGQHQTNWGYAPFGRWTRYAARGDRIFVFGNADFAFRVYSPSGKLVAIYRKRWSPRQVTAVDRRKHLREWVHAYPRPAAWEAREKLFETTTYPATMPAYRDAIPGFDGIVWLEPYDAWDGEQRVFVGYDSTGVAVGKLLLPYAVRILDIGCGYALIGTRDEDGVETARRVTIARDSAESREGTCLDS